MHKKIGTIISGSLSEGLVMRLDGDCAIESITTGKFLCVLGARYRFFSLITDIQLQTTNPDITFFPPSSDDKALSAILSKQAIYALVTLKPMIMLDDQRKKMPVKTIPAHFTAVVEAREQDVAEIFGDPAQDRRFFAIGSPPDMSTPVALNMSAFVERSNGIFGKTGTGKTFITRVILAGLIKNDAAVNLIFDMHSEYGLHARKEGSGDSFVRGLKSLFPHKVAIFSLDPASMRRRGVAPDVDMHINFDDIRVEDVMPLADELNLHPTAVEAAYLIAARYKQRWLRTLLAQENTIKEFAEEVGAHPESVGALFRKLKRLERFPFFDHGEGSSGAIKRLMEYLDRGMHVILEFGTHTSMLAYLLISGIITRRIHEAYTEKTEKFLATQRAEDQPRQLMITIEEAHKFLNPTAAKQTIFGTIAREMRKYSVSLLVVDQRPSGIDPEVLSQIGTKIVSLLNDEKDIAAVLTGVSGAHSLRSVLATLDTKKQALVMGHAVPMPIVIKTREYDELFYQELGSLPIVGGAVQAINEIF